MTPWPTPARALPWGWVILLHLAGPLLGAPRCPAAEGVPPAQPLTTAAEVRKLSVEEARSGRSVELTGVITYYDPRWDTLFIQDDTAGIYVFPGTEPRPRFQAGQYIRMRGRSVVATPFNATREDQVTLLGLKPLPEPVQVNGAQLLSGLVDSRWIELEAVVRGWIIHYQRLEVDLDIGTARIEAHSPGLPGTQPGADFAHARVRVRGVASSAFDVTGRIIGVRLFVPGLENYTIVERPPADPFGLPLQPAVLPIPAASGPTLAKRQRIGGVAILVTATDVVLQSGTNGVRVYPLRPRTLADPEGLTNLRPAPPEIRPGDVVEAVGYAERVEAGPVVTDCLLRKTGSAAEPEPRPVSLLQVQDSRNLNHLVEVEAEIAEELPVEAGDPPLHRWRVERGKDHLEVALPVPDSRKPEVWPGCVVRFHGVAEARVSSTEASSRFRLRLRSPADFDVLRAPPRWLTTEVVRVLGIGAVMTIALLGWALLLWRESGRQRSLNRELEGRIRERTSELTDANRHLEEKVEEQRRVERELLESEARTRTILEHNPEGIVVLDPVTARFVEANEAAARLFEVSRGVLVEKRPFDLSPHRQPDGQESSSAAKDHIQHALRSAPHRFEWVHRNARGRDFLCEINLAPLRMDGRELVIGSITDITARHRAERIRKAVYEISEAAHSAEDLPGLYARLHAVVRQLMNADNLYIASYDETRNLLSFPYYVDEKDPTPPTRLPGKGLTEYVLRTGRPLLADARIAAELIEEELYQPIGSPAALWLGVPLSLRGRPFGVLAVQEYHDPLAFGTEEKEVLGFVAEQVSIAIDRRRAIDELRAGEARLRESEERFSKAFHNNPGSLSLLSLDDGRYLDVNDGFVRTYGHARSDALGKTSLELGLWHDPSHRERLYQLLRDEGCFRNEETVLCRRDGQMLTVVQSADVIEIGGRRCVIVFALDISDRKRAETELFNALRKERELSQLKSNFVSLVSHEFRTPLEVILSSAEILERYHSRLGAEQRARQLQAITTSVRRMAHMMSEVLLLGRFDAGRMAFQPSPLDLSAFCHRVAEEVETATDRRCPIALELERDLDTATGDEALLGHIFTNLLSNAVKYSPPGSVVRFQVRREEGEAVFTVADQGVGIPETDKDRLFVAFHRGSNVGQAPGSGLGLVIVRRCSDLHRGTLRFQSVEGAGTTFEVRIPLWSGAPAPLPAPVPMIG